MPAPQENDDTIQFVRAYGEALLEWARIEQHLFFCHRPKTHDGPRRVLFRQELQWPLRMIEAALQHATIEPTALEVIKAGIHKAVAYNALRNRIAHGGMIILHDDTTPDPAGRPLLAQGKDFLFHIESASITKDQLETARANFATLASILLDAWFYARGARHSRCKPPQECLALIDALPDEADSAKPSQKQLGRLRQRQSAQRKTRPR